MADAVREFLIRTLLRDEGVGAGLDKLIKQAATLSEKTIVLTVKTSTVEVEKQIKSLYKTIESAPREVASEVMKKSGDAAKGLAGHIENLGKMTTKAGDSVANFFKGIDTGRLILGAAGAYLISYATQLSQMYYNFKLNIDLIREQARDLAPMLTSFAMAGGAPGTMSKIGRAQIESYMTMVGYDKTKITGMVGGAEQIFRRTKFGAGLEALGIKSETDLIKALSQPVDETSDLGKALKQKVPEMFKANALQTLRIKVGQEKAFANQGQDVIEQEAQRRWGAMVIEKLAAPGKLEEDTDSYRRSMLDMAAATEDLKVAIADGLAPAISTLATFVTTVAKFAQEHPKITEMASKFILLGIAIAAIGAILAAIISPFILIAVAIAAVLVVLDILNQKFDLVGKAAEALKPIISTVQGIFKDLQSGNIMGALGGGAKLLFQLSPVGIIVGFIEALLPLRRVQESALSVLNALKSIWDNFVRWVSNIWESILDTLIGLPEKIGKFLTSALESLPVVGGQIKAQEQAKRAEDLATKAGFAPGTTFKYGDQTYPISQLARALYWAGPESMATQSLGLPGGGEEALGNILTKDQMQQLVLDYVMAGLPLDTIGGIYGNPALYSQLKEQLKEKAKNIALPEKAIEGPLGPTTISAKSTEQEGVEEVKEKSPLIGETYTRSTETNAEYHDITDPEVPHWGYIVYPNGDLVYDPTDADLTKAGLKRAKQGGEITRAGLIWGDMDEPIVPAEISRSSTLIDRLREIASGRSTGGGGGGGIQIGEIHVNLPPGSVADAASISREIRGALDRELSDFEFNSRVERGTHRMNRAYLA